MKRDYTNDELKYNDRFRVELRRIKIVTCNFAQACIMIDLYDHNLPWPHTDGELYTIVGYEVRNNDEFINYGEPGSYHVARPASYLFELKLYRDVNSC